MTDKLAGLGGAKTGPCLNTTFPAYYRMQAHLVEACIPAIRQHGTKGPTERNRAPHVKSAVKLK